MKWRDEIVPKVKSKARLPLRGDCRRRWWAVLEIVRGELNALALAQGVWTTPGIIGCHVKDYMLDSCSGKRYRDIMKKKTLTVNYLSQR
jgi:hypothetical protein